MCQLSPPLSFGLQVNAAAVEQVSKSIHLQANCVSAPALLSLTEKIGQILPPGFSPDYQVLFANSGAESIENSIKVARTVTGRTTVIVFQGGFHGRTIASGAMTTAKYIYRSGFQPSMADVVVPFPYCYRCPVSKASKGEYCQTNCCQNPMEQLRQMIKQQTGADEVAAILIEPSLGEGGYVLPPQGFLKDVSNFAKEIGALFIADEVQTGYGRTGTYFACEQYGIVPDILVMAKGIANGFPLSAIVASAEVMSRVKPGSVGGTYSGNVVACAAGNAVIDVLTDPKEGILANVNARGEQFRAGLKDMAKRKPHFLIGDIRGKGLWNAIEWQDDPRTVGIAGKLVKVAAENELLIMNTGIYETIRFIPPLTISKAEMEEALTKIEKSLDQILPNKQ
jgi:4-aminobutyrate aminotransferase